MNQPVGAGVDHQRLALQGVEDYAEAPVAAKAHRPQPLLALYAMAQGMVAGIDHADAAVAAIGHIHGL
ncbi:hypothetical protein D3C78_1886620 [compost metagenome]